MPFNWSSRVCAWSVIDFDALFVLSHPDSSAADAFAASAAIAPASSSPISMSRNANVGKPRSRISLMFARNAADVVVAFAVDVMSCRHKGPRSVFDRSS